MINLIREYYYNYITNERMCNGFETAIFSTNDVNNQLSSAFNQPEVFIQPMNASGES